MNIVNFDTLSKSEKLEYLLAEVNGLLAPIEYQILENFDKPRYPVVIIIGVPRCGSTMMMQWLAASSKFAYPTNLLSRFYGAPFIGAKIQQILTEFDYKNEIFNYSQELEFSSKYGKTRGALAPHEFWYFWRRFFPQTGVEYIDESSLHEIDSEGFIRELAALEALFDKPFALKGLIANGILPYLSNLLENVLFIYLKRQPFYNIQSLYRGRLEYCNDPTAWYSFKPKEYEQLKSMTPFEQVAGQVYYLTKSIEDGLGQVGKERKIFVEYEQFCEMPNQYFYKILDKFHLQGYDFDWRYTGVNKFQSSNSIRLPDSDCRKIIDAYQYFSGLPITY